MKEPLVPIAWQTTWAPEPVSKVRKKESREGDKIRNLIPGRRARGVVTKLTELTRLQPDN